MFFGRGIIVNGFLVENMLLLLWNVDDFDMCSDFKVFLKWGFLAEGDVSLGVNRRQRWENFINHGNIWWWCWLCRCFEL